MCVCVDILFESITFKVQIRTEISIIKNNLIIKFCLLSKYIS